ncbi:hypothetical protein GCM10010345_36200 [Streptomyces canarius]|uniref:Uncharacterized protein n=1 Tax=Streptomyces canarius TaxID=285453 RepID=A0ABQ3CM02_9ACTN|nr:hypothetical protein GCM10010345_36200 [Streptomyces canarius]
MQQDAVGESAEPHSQQEAGQSEAGRRGLGSGLAHGGRHRSSSRSVPRGPSVERVRQRLPYESYQLPGPTAAARSAICAQAGGTATEPAGRNRSSHAVRRQGYPPGTGGTRHAREGAGTRDGSDGRAT